MPDVGIRTFNIGKTDCHGLQACLAMTNGRVFLFAVGIHRLRRAFIIIYSMGAEFGEMWNVRSRWTGNLAK